MQGQDIAGCKCLYMREAQTWEFRCAMKVKLKRWSCCTMYIKLNWLSVPFFKVRHQFHDFSWFYFSEFIHLFTILLPDNEWENKSPPVKVENLLYLFVSSCLTVRDIRSQQTSFVFSMSGVYRGRRHAGQKQMMVDELDAGYFCVHMSLEPERKHQTYIFCNNVATNGAERWRKTALLL